MNAPGMPGGQQPRGPGGSGSTGDAMITLKVDPAKQYFYCFGCKASGNAIDFVMKRDRVEFIDALRSLGQAAGIAVVGYDGLCLGNSAAGKSQTGQQ